MIGCLYGLGLLAGNSEVTVMRASGVSLVRIVYFVMKPVLVFIILSAAIGEYFSPYLDQRAEGTREYLRKGTSTQDSAAGLWIREEREFMHFNAVFPGEFSTALLAINLMMHKIYNRQVFRAELPTTLANSFGSKKMSLSLDLMTIKR